MIAQNRQGGAIMDTIYETILNGLFILFSATIVFLPLVGVIPDWLKLSPFYRNTLFALDKMFELKDEESMLRECSASELYVIQKQLKQKIDDFLRGLDE